MQALIQSLREQKPQEIAGLAVEKIIDYRNDDTGLPKSNVLRFFLVGGLEAVVRPSGTEPKLKVYLTAVGETRADAAAVADKLSAHFEAWAKA